MPASDAALRRAVSTAYYAVFHAVLRAAASRFMGPGMHARAGYALLYRSFDHRHMKEMCEALKLPTLKQRLQRQLGRRAVSLDMQSFSEDFVALQEARHEADYDPTAQWTPSDALGLIGAAERAIATFHRITPEEQADMLALLMVKPRA